MIDPREKKKEIRTLVKKLRRQLSKEDALKLSHKIALNLFSLPEYKIAKVILIYIAKGNEVSTAEIIDNALKSGKRVFVPVTFPQKREMKFTELFSDWKSCLEKGVYGILEPKKDCRRFDNKIHEKADLIIVPGIAFDVKCGRIGWGGGYYDRFLKRVSKDIPKVGLAYELQIVDEVPMTENDVRVNIIVTEKRIIRCSS
ncbi:MAG: 5-formyltetrahydrofolate cyclo-ligase [Candidatus Asgardarchaeia archaeon]